jgi:predicted RNase H-like nuclease (RuvC/YqgF family)
MESEIDDTATLIKHQDAELVVKDALLITYRAEIVRFCDQTANLRGDLEEAEAGKDRLEEECARLRADQTKYHHNLTEIAQQHVKDLDRKDAEIERLRVIIHGMQDGEKSNV